MIDAARIGTAAASAIVPSPSLTALQQSLSTLTPGMLPAAVAQALPSGAAAALDARADTDHGGRRERHRDRQRDQRRGNGPFESPPTISGTPPTTVTVGAAYAFTPTASDPDGGTLTFAIANRPSWATFNATTGRLAGTPAARMSAHSPTSRSASATAPRARRCRHSRSRSTPRRTGRRRSPGTPPTTATVGAAYSFTPTASDPDGGTLTFSIANRPSWATFSATTGRLAARRRRRTSARSPTS